MTNPVIDEANKAYAELRANPEAWAEIQAERDLWDVTLLDGLEEDTMTNETTSEDIEAYTAVFAKSAAELIAVLKAAKGDERRKVVAGISKAAMAQGISVEAAGALAHLLNTHGPGLPPS